MAVAAGPVHIGDDGEGEEKVLLLEPIIGLGDNVPVDVPLLPPTLLGLGEGDLVVEPSLPDPRLLLGAGVTVLGFVPLVGDGVLASLDCGGELLGMNWGAGVLRFDCGDGVYSRFVWGPRVLPFCCRDGVLLELACGDGVTPVAYVDLEYSWLVSIPRSNKTQPRSFCVFSLQY